MPVENLIGEENKGWTCAKFLLGHERTSIAGIGISKRELQRLQGHRPAGAQTAVRCAKIHCSPRASRGRNRSHGAGDHSAARSVRRVAERAPGPEASILKIKGTEIEQALRLSACWISVPRILRIELSGPGPLPLLSASVRSSVIRAQ